MPALRTRRVITNLGALRNKVKPKNWYPNRKARRKAGYVRGNAFPGDTIISRSIL